MDILSKCGVKLSDDEETPHVLTQEQSLVIRDIEKCLNQGIKEDNLKIFLNTLKELFDDRQNFKLGLLPTILRKNDVGDINQDSLIRMLLTIDDLQCDIIKKLLDEITRCAPENTNESALFLRLCLSALSNLPYIKQSVKIKLIKIVDVLDIATFENRLEMLNAIPYIIPDSQSDVAGKEISKLLREDFSLAAAIIDCLNALNLSVESKMEIEDILIEFLNDSNAIKFFAVLYEFLVNNTPKVGLFGVLEKCRNALSDVLLFEEAGESHKVIIFMKIGYSMLIKDVQDMYLMFYGKIKEFKSIDILFLILLHSFSDNKKVEVMFKRLVKEDSLRINHLEEFYGKYLDKFIVENYLNSIKSLCSCLICDKKTVDFCGGMFKLTFDNENLNFNQRRGIVETLIMLMGAYGVKNVTETLKILLILSENVTKMKQNAHQMMLLLEYFDIYGVNDAKIVFDILFSLVCGDENYSGIKNELHIIIRKELTSLKTSMKQFGLIGAVFMIKHVLILIKDEGEMENLSRECKECVKLFNLAQNACEDSPSLTALFYDQLADVIILNELNKNFLKWLNEKITADFQNKYLSDSIPKSTNSNVDFIASFSLNGVDEVDSEIYVNIAELTTNQNNEIEILAPFFRLVRVLHYIENNGDLTPINAVLGCGVILPQFEDILCYSMDDLKFVADCLFHCTSWFREVISAFVAQKAKNIRRKVLERLKNLIEIENVLSSVMKQIPHHKLPGGLESEGDPKKIKKPAKRPKLDTTTSSVTTNVTKSKKNVNVVYNFREMDASVMILLKYPLKLETGDLEELSQLTQETTIDLYSFDFLVKDLAKKLETISKHNIKPQNSITSSIKPIEIITDCIRLLPKILNKFNVIHNRLTITLEENNFIFDHQKLFTPEINELKSTITSNLKCLHLIFDWNGFKNPKNLKLLKEAINNVLIKKDSKKLQSLNQLSLDLTNELVNYSNNSLNLTSAVYLIKIVDNLHQITSNCEINKKIISMSLNLLSRPWYDSKLSLEIGKEHYLQLDYLINNYLRGANVKTLGGLISTLQEQVNSLKSKEDNLEMLKAVTKSSFHVLYRRFCTSLLEKIKIEIISLTNNEHLMLWKTTALSLQGLMAIVKVQESHSNLIHFLKQSIGVFKIFLSQGIPIMEILLRNKTDQVIEILKTLQLTVRFLHHLCCHSKITKDISLIAHVPRCRLTLETFVFRVKAMLVANDCSAAFWMGNLKNRDLHGEEILSQNSISTDQNVNDEDEELPPDEDDSDVDGSEVEERSASEIFD
nr:Fanconi anemia group D2 protein [Onthophagus taurus]